MRANAAIVRALRALIVLVSFQSAHAQPCEGEWSDKFIAPVADNPSILARFDDGSGPKVYIGGALYVAGGLLTYGIASWDGDHFARVGSGFKLDAVVTALTTHDGPGGPALYAAGFGLLSGSTRQLVKWDGADWSPVIGTSYSGTVYAMVSHGGELYVAGSFQEFEGIAASRIAKWDGQTWTPVGSGLNNTVRALATYDDGTGPALYAAGDFDSAGGTSVKRIAKWDGVGWSALGSGLNGTGRALAVLSDQNGSRLCVAGAFTQAGGKGALRVAQWNGEEWSPFGAGLSSDTWGLCVSSVGGPQSLHALGSFSGLVQRWNGQAWAKLGAGLSEGSQPTAVAAAGFDPGTGEQLVVVGDFMKSGDLGCNNFARWDGAAWVTAGLGFHHALSNYSRVDAMAAHDDGAGPALFVGGNFLYAGQLESPALAKWQDGTWTPIGASTVVNAMASFDDGSGPALYVSAITHGIKVWREGKLSDHSAVANGLVEAMLVHDDGQGPGLFVAGHFSSIGGEPASCVAKWNGIKWQQVGSGLVSLGSVYALAIHDDGTGPALYAAGDFKGKDVPNQIAKWDGTTWLPLGSGVAGSAALALASYPSPEGPTLYVGGAFSTAGGIPAKGLAMWRNGQWYPGPASWGTTGSVVQVRGLAVLDDGTGSALYASGTFNFAGNTPAKNLARWDNQAWKAIGQGLQVHPTSLDPAAKAMLEFDDGTGPALWFGGGFCMAGPYGSNRIAKLQLCKSCYPDCDSSGELDIDDFICFQTEFGIGDPKADCDASGELDIDDFICFQTAFGLGCP